MIDSTMHLLLAALAFVSDSTGTAVRPELRRRADWGFRLGPTADSSAFEIKRVTEGSAAAAAGLRVGDRVTEINGQRPKPGVNPLRVLRGGDTLRFAVAGKSEITFTAPAMRLEQIPGCDVIYGSVETPAGYRVRTVLTKPKNVSGQLPVLIFLPWLSCDAVENPGVGDGWMQMLHGVAARTGWALFRVEKPGVGDSEGQPCSQNDLEADLAAFRAAVAHVRTLDGIDASRIVIFGGSIGAALAPIVAAESHAAGVIATGGFSRTWYEHMLEIERARLTLEGTAPAEINRQMKGYAAFYDLFLHEKLTPAQVLAKRPDLASLWHDEPDGQYGRPAAYYHQAEALDVGEAWAKIDVPVLVLHGEYDWIMSENEARHAVQVVNAHAPGRATLVILPATDHHFGVYDTPVDAYREQGGHFGESVVTHIADWLGTHF